MPVLWGENEVEQPAYYMMHLAMHATSEKNVTRPKVRGNYVEISYKDGLKR